jgi:hypothetical protein
VSRVRLYLHYDRGDPDFLFVRPGGKRDSIPALRVRADVDLVSHVRPSGPDALRAAYPECVLDTGSPISIIPEYVWSHFYPGAVTPLPFDVAMPSHRRFVSVGGGNFPYTLGELAIRLFDQKRRSMDLRIVAQLTQDGGALTIPMTLGLRGGVIDGRILRAEPDAAAPFGQKWLLEDP